MTLSVHILQDLLIDAWSDRKWLMSCSCLQVGSKFAIASAYMHYPNQPLSQE